MQSYDIEPQTLRALQERSAFFWANPDHAATLAPNTEIDALIEKAQDRMLRAAKLLQKLFDLPSAGVGQPAIRSALIPLSGLSANIGGPVFAKGDHALPVAGSVKARGGFHEVIAYAERLAIAAGLITEGADLAPLAGPEAKELFARHSIVVGSTGNLGMSIGLCGAALGFRAVVHMSVDAKGWKKDRLRSHGVEVVEHDGDYGAAVAEGRALAEADPLAHFVDDERSLDLFCGYACAARELQEQLLAAGVIVGPTQPLVVHLPCGVGGAPGGIAYGLRQVYGADVYCIFAEPVDAPCMLVQLASGRDDREVSVYDIGLTNKTELDGLAVGAASMVVAPLMRQRLSGVYTVTDAEAHDFLRHLYQGYGLKVEPSAATSIAGPLLHWQAMEAAGIPASKAAHVAWLTGGALVPDVEFGGYLNWR